jgi:hypothetical protein
MTTQKDIIIDQLSLKHGINVKADDFHALRSEQAGVFYTGQKLTGIVSQRTPTEVKPVISSPCSSVTPTKRAKP